MEKLLLVGAGGFGRVVLEHAIELYDCAFLDDGDAVIWRKPKNKYKKGVIKE